MHCFHACTAWLHAQLCCVHSFLACTALLHAQRCGRSSFVTKAAGLKLECLQERFVRFSGQQCVYSLHLQQCRLCVSRLLNVGAEVED